MAKRSFTCSDCRVVIDLPVQLDAWELMRQHAIVKHGREPHCNPAGQYQSLEAQVSAEMGAFPERYFIMAA